VAQVQAARTKMLPCQLHVAVTYLDERKAYGHNAVTRQFCHGFSFLSLANAPAVSAKLYAAARQENELKGGMMVG